MLLWLMLACTGGSNDDTGATDTGGVAAGEGMGTLALSFAIDDDYFDAMEEPATGPFRATIYNADDVSGIGPADGAREYGDIVVDTVDLTTGEPTAVLLVTDPMPNVWVTILGFMDSDGNSVEPHGPDRKDPVTLPNDNEFLVVHDAETPAQVFFGLLNP